MAEAPGMKQRRGDHAHIAGSHREHRQQRQPGAETGALLARHPLGGAGRSRGQDDRPTGTRRPRRVTRVTGVRELVQRRPIRWAVVPGDEPDHVWGGTVEDCPELLVVHHGDHALALEDVAQLGSGKAGVERDRIGTELGECRDRLNETGVVPTQHADLRPRAHTARPKRVGLRVTAPVQLRVGEHDPLVDDRRALRIPRGVGREATGKGRPVIPQRTPECPRPVRSRRPQEPRTAQNARVRHQRRQVSSRPPPPPSHSLSRHRWPQEPNVG